jgi:uncharacterized protein YcbX
MVRVVSIQRYPVKGLSAEPLKRTMIAAGDTLPYDRAYAIENGPSGFDPAAPTHYPKIVFLMLMRHERLAELETRFDAATTTLTIRKDGTTVAEGNLETEAGRRVIETFFDSFATRELRGPARILRSPGHTFADARGKLVSLINLETVRALGKDLGADLHPLRFRGNLHVEGWPAWGEFDLVGKSLKIGGATFTVTKRIDRCDATNVNPVTAARDQTIPRSMQIAYGHADIGIYLEVTGAGEIAEGDSVTVVG